MKRFLLIVTMLFGAIGTVQAETINLTCTDRNGTYNLTIVTPTQKQKGRMFHNDREMSDFAEYQYRVESMTVTNSDIYVTVTLKSPDGPLIKTIYYISRVTGAINATTSSNGKINEEITNNSVGKCGPRKQNLF